MDSSERPANLLDMYKERRMGIHDALMRFASEKNVTCPEVGEPPKSAVPLGAMPVRLRGLFAAISGFRSGRVEGFINANNVEQFEEVLNHSMLTNFGKYIHTDNGGRILIGQFILGKNWQMFALPLRRDELTP